MLLREQPNKRVQLKDEPTPEPGAGATEQDEVLIDTLRGFTLPTTSLSYNPAARTGQGLNNKFAQGFLNGAGVLETFTHRGGGPESKAALFQSRDVVNNQVLDARMEQAKAILGRGARSEAYFPQGGVRALNSGIALLDPEVAGNQYGGATVTSRAPQAIVGNRDVVKSTPITRLNNFRQGFNIQTTRAPMSAPNPYQASALSEYLSVAKQSAAGENMRRLRMQAKRAD